MSKRFFFCFVFAFTALCLKASSPLEGVLYLKDGRKVEFQGRDRILLPKKRGDVKAFRDMFYKTKRKEVFSFKQIDSLVCWHPKAPQYRRKYLPCPSVGWCWVYIETPYIRTLVYAEKGYGVGSDGGADAYQRNGTFSRSRVAYYLQKGEGNELYSLGDAKFRSGQAFRKRLLQYIDDDPDLCRSIEKSDLPRYRMVYMLKDYRPDDDSEKKH